MKLSSIKRPARNASLFARCPAQAVKRKKACVARRSFREGHSTPRRPFREGSQNGLRATHRCATQQAFLGGDHKMACAPRIGVPRSTGLFARGQHKKSNTKSPVRHVATWHADAWHAGLSAKGVQHKQPITKRPACHAFLFEGVRNKACAPRTGVVATQAFSRGVWHKQSNTKRPAWHAGLFARG